MKGQKLAPFNPTHLGKLLLIYICNFHVLSYLLLIYICKLHWNLNPTHIDAVNLAIDMLSVSAEDIVYDLGCGVNYL